MQLHVSAELAALTDEAFAHAASQGQFFVGVEHLFRATLDHADDWPVPVREQYYDVLHAIARENTRCKWTAGMPATVGEIFHSPRAIASLTKAGKLAARLGHPGANAAHLMLAILADAHSAPSRSAETLGIDRVAIQRVLERELMGNPVPTPSRVSAGGTAPPTTARAPATTPGTSVADGASTQQPPEASAAKPPPSLTRDLNDAAQRGELKSVIGRDSELFTVVQILARHSKNNVMLVGEAGVGKTQLVEGLARKMAQQPGAIEGLENLHFVELNLAALLSGTHYRGALEERLIHLIDQVQSRPGTVLFIDEVHLLLGAGATDGDSMDVANLLKPVLGRSGMRVIGATTVQEYRKFVQKDPAIERRFQMVRLEPLSEGATLEVLRRLRPSLEKHHHLKISSRSLEAAIMLTQRFMPNRNLPDKAIDVLDQACARYRLRKLAFESDSGQTIKGLTKPVHGKVTPHDVRKVVSQLSGVPMDELTLEMRRNLSELEQRVRKQIIGQDEAISRVVSVVKRSRAGLADPNRPEAVLLFLGPSGVGKTQLAKVLAKELYGSSSHLTTFDMSEYIEEHSVSRLLGAPPGYQGGDEEGRLSQAVRSNPYSILLFDEIEKAHPRVFDIFLPIFDEGRLRDNRGQQISFRNCMLIMTSNVGANLVSEMAIAPETNGKSSRQVLTDILTQHFRPEFVNRIDEIVPFHPLLAEDVRSILRLEIDRVRRRLADKKISIRMFQFAYEYLGNLGFSEAFGARELRRVVERHVVGPLSEGLVSGEFDPGDTIEVLMEDGTLVLRKGRPHQPSGASPARPESSES